MFELPHDAEKVYRQMSNLEENNDG